MALPDNLPDPCTSCKTRPATASYKNAYVQALPAVEVCEACLDRLALHDAWQHRSASEMMGFVDREEYDEALRWLDAFWEAHKHRDVDRWLARSVAASRHSILYWAERDEEALLALEEAEKLGFDNVSYRYAHAADKAQVLEALGRPEEALAVFEEAFRVQEPRYAAAAAYYLRVLVEIAEKAGKPVDPKWLDVARAVAEAYGIELPQCDSLAETLLAVNEATAKRVPKRI